MQSAHDKLFKYIAQSCILLETKDPPLKRIVKFIIPASLLPTIRRGVTNLLFIRELRRAQKLQRQIPLQLHLGSARSLKAGWVNVDMVGHPVDLIWNIEKRLPFKDLIVDAIFHEHLLEHLTLRKGFALMKECYRVLKPGGILRVGVPDAEAYMGSYIGGGKGLINLTRPGRPTSLLALQEVLYWYGHLVMYDFDTLALLFNAAGFERVGRRQFGCSLLTPCPDSEHRRLGTLYVEAMK